MDRAELAVVMREMQWKLDDMAFRLGKRNDAPSIVELAEVESGLRTLASDVRTVIDTDQPVTVIEGRIAPAPERASTVISLDECRPGASSPFPRGDLAVGPGE